MSVNLLGASNHVPEDREANDYYATDPTALEMFLGEGILLADVLEPCCGEGHLSKALVENGIKTTSSDLIDRGYGSVKSVYDYTEWKGDILTNPPYKEAEDIVRHCLGIIPTGRHVIMFLKLLFLEGQKRRKFFNEFPPKYVCVSSSRIGCAKNGDFKSLKSSAICYAWYVWEKGFKGDPIIKWFN